MRSSTTLHSSYILLSHKIFLHKSFLSFTKKWFVLQTNKKIKKLIKNPTCLPGGLAGPKASATPFCMKSAGGAQSRGRWGGRVWGFQTWNAANETSRNSDFLIFGHTSQLYEEYTCSIGKAVLGYVHNRKIFQSESWKMFIEWNFSFVANSAPLTLQLPTPKFSFYLRCQHQL